MERDTAATTSATTITITYLPRGYRRANTAAATAATAACFVVVAVVVLVPILFRESRGFLVHPCTDLTRIVLIGDMIARDVGGGGNGGWSGGRCTQVFNLTADSEQNQE